MKAKVFLGAALLAFASPAMAQNAAEAPKSAEKTDPFAALATMFQVEPLTPEQRARLPEAEALMAKLVPTGALDKTMTAMFERMIGPMLGQAKSPGNAEIARTLGLDVEELDLSEDEAAQAGAILDPAWKERGERERAATQAAMSKVMRLMEPSLRKGMAEAYAATFTAAELADIAAFFATPTGATYASKSYSLASDPRILAASFESLPTLMVEMAGMEAEMRAATADLPAKRGYDDLSPAERTTLATLTGLSVAELKAGMDRAAEARDEAPSTRDDT